MDLCSFLSQTWDGVALAALVGGLWSLILQLIPAWRDWQTEYKRVAVLVLCFVLPILAYLLAPVLECLRPAFHIVLNAGFIAFGMSQVVYEGAKRLLPAGK